jgi:hypothetical protein
MAVARQLDQQAFERAAFVAEVAQQFPKVRPPSAVQLSVRHSGGRAAAHWTRVVMQQVALAHPSLFAGVPWASVAGDKQAEPAESSVAPRNVRRPASG